MVKDKHYSYQCKQCGETVETSGNGDRPCDCPKCDGFLRIVDRWGTCESCGEEVGLMQFTNTCRCGADYNSSGQRLAPRSQWGEETFESVADILAVDSEDDYSDDYDYDR